MSNKDPIGAFLTALPALLQAVSHRTLRALAALASRLVQICKDTAAFIADFLVAIATSAWHFYCRLESSVIDTLSTVLLILWSLRLFALLLAPALALAYFTYWLGAVCWLGLLALAVWKFYVAPKEDIEKAAESQAPVRALLVRILRFLLRAVLAITSVIGAMIYAVPFGDSKSGAADPLSSIQKIAEKTIEIGSSKLTSISPAGRSKNAEERTAKDSSAKGTASEVSRIEATDFPANSTKLSESTKIAIDRAFELNYPSILKTLALARMGANDEVESMAKAAARNYDYLPTVIVPRRDRRIARPLNEQANAMFAELGPEKAPSQYLRLLNIQRGAFVADSADVEIAGNLAIYELLAGDAVAANKYVVYAMSLPRNHESTGRTADWSTLSAVLAVRGDYEGAANALFVTLAISTDLEKRCKVAVHATRRTYGPILRATTEAMFERIRERQLSDVFACSLPILW